MIKKRPVKRRVIKRKRVIRKPKIVIRKPKIMIPIQEIKMPIEEVKMPIEEVKIVEEVGVNETKTIQIQCSHHHVEKIAEIIIRGNL